MKVLRSEWIEKNAPRKTVALYGVGGEPGSGWGEDTGIGAAGPGVVEEQRGVGGEQSRVKLWAPVLGHKRR